MYRNTVCGPENNMWPRNIAIIKKSTIFTQFLWDVVKRTTSWVGPFDKVPKKLAKNCGFFIKSSFLGHMSFLGSHTVWYKFFYVSSISLIISWLKLTLVKVWRHSRQNLQLLILPRRLFGIWYLILLKFILF